MLLRCGISTQDGQRQPTASPLLNLPAEIRQQILFEVLSQSITIILDNTTIIATRLKRVCRLLRADFAEILPLWLPEPTTKVVIKSPEGTRRLADLQRQYTELAARSGRQWGGIQTIRMQVIRNIAWPQNPTTEIKADQLFTLNPLQDHDYALLPDTVNKIIVDLTMPPKPLRSIKAWWPDASHCRGAPPEGLAEFWYSFTYALCGSDMVVATGLFNVGNGPAYCNYHGTYGRDGKKLMSIETKGRFPPSHIQPMLFSKHVDWHRLSVVEIRFEDYFKEYKRKFQPHMQWWEDMRKEQWEADERKRKAEWEEQEKLEKPKRKKRKTGRK
ncbi:hypothetical protein BU16DRAFT_582413 [Lophium mytilinum]|uniref:Uncharacterized protein n=1 Tax=Lophium mytilinum TaxID=390894 RepID=A0A6A6QQ05_9PEZI|nr:hypothetical protein BU16DRAFT_582413 [Lophium mytilinum]